MTRKEELKQELKSIETKEMEKKLKELDHLEASVESKLKLADAKTHRWIIFADSALKTLFGMAIIAAFIHIVYTGNVDAMETNLIGERSSNGNFQLLSVVGPLFGVVLQYYFGKNKAGANGE